MEEKHYRIKTGYSVEDIAGQQILITPDLEQVDCSKMLVLSESAALISRLLIERPHSFEEMLQALTREYNADENLIRSELSALLEKFAELRVLE